MDLKASTQEPGDLPSISESNPDEKEISDDEDDDRNHKHRRRDDARSQSQEREAAGQVYTKPYRRGNKSFENGNFYKEFGSQSGEPWKNHSFNPNDSKFDKRRHLDLNQRIRGRGRDSGVWTQRDIASQMGPGLFGGRGLPTVGPGLPNAYGPSWGAFAMVPGLPNGGLDPLHSLGLQGAYRSINPSMNMGLGLPRQRCRDFEEQGFCLRGDMCPMEHGVNRIVVEDVQSLSQFNLPVSLQNVNTPGGSVPLPASGASTNSFKSSHGKTSKRGVGPSGSGLNEAFIGSTDGMGADFYDPDQPLWGNDSQTSPALQSINQSNVKESGSLLDPGPSGDHRVGPLDGSDEHVFKSSGTTMGRINSSKDKTEMRGNVVSKELKASSLIEKQGPLNNKQNNTNMPLKTQSGNGKNVRKPSEKAQCTLFVNGVPLQQNRRETLISHFHKFGEVIDIHIPLNSERAFVQFSKREEAEAALTAPDAVMGNRFIKLWWANRDNIPINGTISGYTMPPVPPRGMPVSSSHNDINAPASDHPKPVIINTPKPLPPSQKKLENLEVLKEELRKKQEMLDQKRNDFRRKLEKLAKQATKKGEIEPEQVTKKQKLGVVADSTKAETVLSSPGAEVIGNGKKCVDSSVPQRSKSTAVIATQEPLVVKPPLRPLPPFGPSVATNRFKLDNRPTAFKIVSSLPVDLANVAVLKEHFSQFGDLSKVELDDLEPADSKSDPGSIKYSAYVYFTTRQSAEKAFLNGKCWNGHNLEFSWLKPSNHGKNGQTPSSTPKGNSEASVGPVVENPKTNSQKSGDEDSEKLEQKDVNKELDLMETDESINAS